VSQVIRIKHTFGPPRVCAGCFWEAKFIRQARLFRKLRDELLRLQTQVHGRRKGKAERDDDEDGETVVVDLVDGFAQIE
jgi:hypothetical protein